MDYTQNVRLFAPKNKSNGCSNAKCLILPNFAVDAKSEESRKSLIFRILPRIAFACCGPTGLCILECVRLYNPKQIVVCEADEGRREFVRRHYPNVDVVEPWECDEVLDELTDDRGADRVIEVAGGEDTFELAWRCGRPNAIVTIVALYEKEQILPLPWMYGKNLTFKTGGVDACDCDKIMHLIAEGKIDTTHLITHRFPLSRIQEAYNLFAKRGEGVIKTAIYPD